MDKALRQRLVGALVLIALAVIVLPMLLGGRPQPDGAETRSVDIPSPPAELEFETRRFPVGLDLQQENDREADADAVSLPETLPQPAAAADDTPPATGAEPGSQGDTAGQAQPVGLADATGAAEDMDRLIASMMHAGDDAPALRYVVQVASFGSPENALNLAAQLEQAGYAVSMDSVSGETGTLNRVRVGPYAAEGEAQDVARDLQGRFDGLKPRVVDMKPDAASPALASDDPLLRWVVQVGSFSSIENAENLVARLRSSGLSAYSEAVTSGTATIHRVRIGPFLERAQAMETEQRIGTDLGIDGVVMSSN